MSEKKIPKKKPYPPVLMTVWQDAWLAITQPRQYLKWAFQPFWRSVKYIIILNVVMAMVATAYLIITIKPALLEFADWAEEAIPQITLKEGILSVEDDQAFTYTDSDAFFIKVDTTQKSEDEPVIDSFYEIGILITQDEVILKNKVEVNHLKLTDFGLKNFDFNGESLAEWIRTKLFSFTIVLAPLLIFIYLMIAKLLYSAIFATLAYFLSGMKYNLVHIWSLAIYTLTPAIIAGYLSFIFYPIWGFYTAIYLTYLILVMGHYIRFQGIKDSIKEKN